VRAELLCILADASYCGRVVRELVRKAYFAGNVNPADLEGYTQLEWAGHTATNKVAKVESKVERRALGSLWDLVEGRGVWRIAPGEVAIDTVKTRIHVNAFCVSGRDDGDVHTYRGVLRKAMTNPVGLQSLITYVSTLLPCLAGLHASTCELKLCIQMKGFVADSQVAAGALPRRFA